MVNGAEVSGRLYIPARLFAVRYRAIKSRSLRLPVYSFWGQTNEARVRNEFRIPAHTGILTICDVGVTCMLRKERDWEPDYLRKSQAPRGGSIAEGLAI